MRHTIRRQIDERQHYHCRRFNQFEKNIRITDRCPGDVFSRRGDGRFRRRLRRLRRAAAQARMAAGTATTGDDLRRGTRWSDGRQFRVRPACRSHRPQADDRDVGCAVRPRQSVDVVCDDARLVHRAAVPHWRRAGRRHADGHHAQFGVQPGAASSDARHADVLRLYDRPRIRRPACGAHHARLGLARRFRRGRRCAARSRAAVVVDASGIAALHARQAQVRSRSAACSGSSVGRRRDRRRTCDACAHNVDHASHTLSIDAALRDALQRALPEGHAALVRSERSSMPR